MNDKYLQFDLEEFLMDDEFIDWVLDDKNGAEWNSWLNDHPESIQTISEAKKIVHSLKFSNPSIKKSLKPELWNRIEESTKTREVSIASSGRRRLIIAIAAAASIALLAIFLIPSPKKSIIANEQIAEVITLPSNSIVTIEPSSAISYKDGSWEKERVVDLKGQAHFKVSKGVPFKVVTPTGNVEVLGTEFDVVSEKDIFYVKVDEGKVSASTGTITEILSGDMAIYRNPRLEGQFGLDDSWRVENTIFAFNEKPLSNALAAIEFQFGNQIVSESLNTDILYTGSFNSSEGLRSSLQNVLWPLNLTFEIEGNSILLQGD